MGKLLTVDDVEIEFEKQSEDHACEWCIYVRVRKNEKQQNKRKKQTTKETINFQTWPGGMRVSDPPPPACRRLRVRLHLASPPPLCSSACRFSAYP